MNIRDLGVIGDRRTCALVTTEGNIVWYCPTRFDKPAFLSQLLDEEKGGYWKINFDQKAYQKRYYKDSSSVLTTCFSNHEVTDFMPMNSNFKGICRLFSAAPVDVQNEIFLKPFYGLGLPEYEEDKQQNIFIISRSLYFTASHPIHIKKGKLSFTIPEGEEGWAFLSEEPIEGPINKDILSEAKQQTLYEWEKLAEQVNYEGPYYQKVMDSFRAIQLLTYQENGGIIAAGTTSLPETIGDSRNYDYRYVWLRDSAMIMSALIRAQGAGEEEQKFLSFLCDTKYRNNQKLFLPFYSLDKLVVQPEEAIPLQGYKNSRPVRIGNDAMDQLQLDANANILIAAKMIYQKVGAKEHWETVSGVADYLVERWDEEDHGIWEEHIKKHFTSSKVVVAKGLEFISEYADNYAQKERWLDTAAKIRRFIRDNCMTADGAFASYAGSEHVDITAALFPEWTFVKPDESEMVKTAEQIERDLKEGELYHRRLELYDSKKEGVFLAGSLWMSQYYIMMNDLERAKKIINAALEFSNDLGFFAEEGHIKKGEMLGNFPQTFVHASFIGAVVDLKNKMRN